MFGKIARSSQNCVASAWMALNLQVTRAASLNVRMWDHYNAVVQYILHIMPSLGMVFRNYQYNFYGAAAVS